MSSSATGQNGEMIRFTLWLKQTKLQTKYETNRTHWVAGSDLRNKGKQLIKPYGCFILHPKEFQDCREREILKSLELEGHGGQDKQSSQDRVPKVTELPDCFRMCKGFP